MSEENSPRGASRSALGVAAHRALHQQIDGEPKILNDTVSARLLGDTMQSPMLAHMARSSDPADKNLRVRVVLRSRFAEDRLADAVRRGVRQCVVLGAGFDTFAYRQPEWSEQLRIFEIDHGGTQREKRRRLAAAGVAIPSNLDFVEIDFERMSLRDGLALSALDFSAPAFFSCLGVLVYLTRDAADAVFALVAGFPAGSEIVFTYAGSGTLDSPTADRARAAGEPWQTQFEPAALKRDLNAMGFSDVSFLRSEDAQERYFQGRSDGLHAPPRTEIASAIV